MTSNAHADEVAMNAAAITEAVPVGSHPIVTSQYSSTALYQVSYHNQSLFFLR